MEGQGKLNITDDLISKPTDYSYVNLTVGTPPQPISAAVALGAFGGLTVGTLLVPSETCVFCPGADAYDPTLSSTFRVRDHEISI
jgi:hypothetical protein